MDDAHLRSPVTEIVHGCNLPSAGLVQIRQEPTDDCAPQVADMKGLCNIGRRIFYDDLLALSRAVASVAWDLVRREMSEGVHLGKHVANKGRTLALKVQEGFIETDRFDVFVRLKLCKHKIIRKKNSRAKVRPEQ